MKTKNDQDVQNVEQCTKRYSVKKSSLKQDQKKEQIDSVTNNVGLTSWDGGSLTNKAQAINGLQFIANAEKIFKEFKLRCREFTDEYGPLEHDGKSWHCRPYEATTAISGGIRTIVDILMRVGADDELIDKFLAECRRENIGQMTVRKRYGWGK